MDDPNAQVRLRREMDHNVVLANIPEGTPVDPRVYEYVERLKRGA